MYTYIYIYIYISLSLCIYTYVCISIYLSLSLSIYIYMYTCNHIYIYIYIYARARALGRSSERDRLTDMHPIFLPGVKRRAGFHRRSDLSCSSVLLCASFALRAHGGAATSTPKIASTQRAAGCSAGVASAIERPTFARDLSKRVLLLNLSL